VCGEGQRFVSRSPESDRSIPADARAKYFTFQRTFYVRSLWQQPGKDGLHTYHRVWFFSRYASPTKKRRNLIELLTANCLSDALPHIFGLREFAALLRTRWFCDAQQKSFDFSKMLVFNREIDRKAVPRIAMAVFYMCLKPATQCCGKTDIVQFALPKEGVDACIATNELSNQFGMTLQRVSGYVFQMLVN